MKLSKIINPKFKDVLRKLVTEEMPIKTALKLKKISLTVEKSLTDYETVRLATIKKHAELDETGEPKSEEGNAVFSSVEARLAFGQELSEVLDLDIDVENLSIEELGDKVSISVVDLIILDDIISAS